MVVVVVVVPRGLRNKQQPSKTRVLAQSRTHHCRSVCLSAAATAPSGNIRAESGLAKITQLTVQTPQYLCHELTAAESTAWRVWKRLAAAIASIEPVLFCGSRAPTINLADCHAYFEVLSHETERRERCAIPFLTVCWARKPLYLVFQQCQRHANTGMRLEPCQRSQTYNSHFPVRPPLLRSPFRRLGRV